MDDAIMGGLFPMPERQSGPLQFNHAKLWKRRRLRLEAEAAEQACMKSDLPVQEAARTEKRAEEPPRPRAPERPSPAPEAQI